MFKFLLWLSLYWILIKAEDSYVEYPGYPDNYHPPQVNCSAGDVPTPSDCCKKIHNPTECLALANCSWCIQENFHPPKCNWHDKLIKYRCLPENIVDEIPSDIILPPDGSTIDLPVVSGSAFNLTVTWPTLKPPLDVYFIFDTSSKFSAKGATMDFAFNSKVLLSSISTDWRIGLGRSSDKPVLPLGSAMDHSFISVLPLTPGVDDLGERIDYFPFTSGGSDFKGGYLDAIAQALICKDQIGWRNEALKVLILITASDYHVQGDGARATPPITTPFDGACHLLLDLDYTYTEGLNMDYPSVAQIKEYMAARGSNVILVFAVDESSHAPVYANLAAQIPNSILAELSSGSTNLTNALGKALVSLSGSFIIKETVNPSSLATVRSFSDCHAPFNPVLMEINRCPAYGPTVTFVIEVDVGTCPPGVEEMRGLVVLGGVGDPSGDLSMNIITTCNP